MPDPGGWVTPETQGPGSECSCVCRTSSHRGLGMGQDIDIDGRRVFSVETNSTPT